MDRRLQEENEKKKEYLKSYQRAVKRERDILEEIKRLRADKMFPSVVNDGMPKGSSQAEYNQNFELAAIGFRSSLEILVKDYAIQELGEPAETVAKQSLCNAIATYLQQADLVNTADVVRILGNDYTHYKRKYPEHDFVLLKKYMEIFLSQIEVKYMIKHPPVARS